MKGEDQQDNAGVIVPAPFFYAGVLVIGIVLNAFFPVPFLPSVVALIVGLPLIAIGILVVRSAFRALGRENTSPDPYEPTTKIVVDGPFRFTRNPIYLSFTLIYLGITLAFNTLWALLLLLPVLLAIDRGVILREEKYLEPKFGDEYLRYKAKVRRWI